MGMRHPGRHIVDAEPGVNPDPPVGELDEVSVATVFASRPRRDEARRGNLGPPEWSKNGVEAQLTKGMIERRRTRPRINGETPPPDDSDPPVRPHDLRTRHAGKS